MNDVLSAVLIATALFGNEGLATLATLVIVLVVARCGMHDWKIGLRPFTRNR